MPLFDTQKKQTALLFAIALVVIGGLTVQHLFKRDVGPKPYEDSEIVNFVAHDLAKIFTFDSAAGLDAHLESITPYLTGNGVKTLRETYTSARIFESPSYRQEALDVARPTVEAAQKNGQWAWHYKTNVRVRQILASGKEHTESWDVEGYVAPKDDTANYLGFENIVAYPPEHANTAE